MSITVVVEDDGSSYLMLIEHRHDEPQDEVRQRAVTAFEQYLRRQAPWELRMALVAITHTLVESGPADLRGKVRTLYSVRVRAVI